MMAEVSAYPDFIIAIAYVKLAAIESEEPLEDSVINNHYPNKLKLIIRYLHLFSTVINTPVENFIKTFVEK